MYHDWCEGKNKDLEVVMLGAVRQVIDEDQRFWSIEKSPSHKDLLDIRKLAWPPNEDKSLLNRLGDTAREVLQQTILPYSDHSHEYATIKTWIETIKTAKKGNDDIRKEQS